MQPRRWLLLRGLAREQRHFGAFPATFAHSLGVDVVTIDLPGFGTEHRRASPTDIAAITDDVRSRFAHSGEQCGIFAISLGGMVALDWAARYADDFSRVVVANTSAADLSPPWQRFSMSILPKLPTMLGAPAIDRERMILGITSNRGVAENEITAREWADFYIEKTPARASFARQLYAATRSRLPRSIKAPVLVLTSTADRLVSSHCSTSIARVLGAKLAVHGEAGHDITLDAPAWVCEQVAS